MSPHPSAAAADAAIAETAPASSADPRYQATLEALAESQAHLREVIGSAPLVLYALDRNGVFTLSEGRGLEAVGLAPGEVVGVSVFDLYADVPEVLEHVRRALAGEEVSAVATVAGFTFESHYLPYVDADGEVEKVVGVSLDISEQQRAKEELMRAHEELERRVEARTAELAALNARLKHEAFHDALTGLPNRALFVDRLEHAVRRAGRPGAAGFSVAFLDLDDFKVVNDSLGHAAGDRLLVEVGRRLVDFFRPGDTVARFGGDEFAVLLEDVTERADLERIAARIEPALRTVSVLGHEIRVGASVGVVSGALSGPDVEEILRDADIAMYRAKALGKGRYALFEPAMRAQAQRRLMLEAELRQAISRGQLGVRYQPILDARSGQLRGFEALVRWEHPQRGVVSPGDFIPLAEETGLVIDIDRFVLETACAQMVRWQEATGTEPSLSVNLSSQQFDRDDLAAAVAGALERTGFAAERLHLEMTESLLVSGSPQVAAALEALRALGVELHLDDFGTGYSSLAYLQRFSAHVLKIDRGFIDGVIRSEQTATLVRTIVMMADALGMRVVAEGVETQEQLELLREIGCDYVQGYLFSSPLAPEAAEQYLAAALRGASTD